MSDDEQVRMKMYPPLPGVAEKRIAELKAENTRLNGLDAAQAATIRSLEAENTRLTAALAQTQRAYEQARTDFCVAHAGLEKVRDALVYAGVGAQYPHDRLPQIIRSKAATCRNDDDRMFWYTVAEKLIALAPDQPAPEARLVNDLELCPKCGHDLDTGWECIACGYDASGLVDRGRRSVLTTDSANAPTVSKGADHRVRETPAEPEARDVGELVQALEGLLDGLDANVDPERCGLAADQWDKRVAFARAALERREEWG